MIADDRRDGVRHHRDRDRGAAPRGEPDQAAEAALQRAAARRQVAPLHPAHRRPRGAADREASRRAQAAGRLFRALRQRLGRQPHDQRAAARLPAALLQRQLSSTTAPAPACCSRSSAARRRARGEIAIRGLCRASSRRRAPSCPASRTPSRSSIVGEMDEAAEELEFERAARYRDRLAALSAVQATQGINTQRRRGGRRVRARRAGRAVLRRGVLLPQLAELGQPRLFPEGRQDRCRPARCWRRSWPSSTTTSRRRA